MGKPPPYGASVGLSPPWGATTSARMLSSGTGVVNHGHVAGYFTFRRITPSA